VKYLQVLFLALVLHFMGISVFADTIYLRDGRSYKGEFIKGDKNGILFQSGEKIMGFPLKYVLFIFFGTRNVIWEQKDGLYSSFPLSYPAHLRPENEDDAGVVYPENQGEKEGKGTIEVTERGHFKEIEAEPMLGDLPEEAGP
jgi:hypothetical protein